MEKESLPNCLKLSAWTDDGMVMGICHREHPIAGIQFHLESILNTVGKHILRSFLHQSCRV